MAMTEASSRPINLWLVPREKHAPAIYDRLDLIQDEVERQEARRKRGGASAVSFRKCLRAICLDLFDAYVADADMQVGVPRDKNVLSGRDIAQPLFVSARPFLDALSGLENTGYIETVSIGNEASGRRTRVKGTQRLVDKLGVAGLKPEHLLDTSDPIVLRIKSNGKKKRHAFVDTDQIVRWRGNVEQINRHLEGYRLTLDLTQKQTNGMEADRLSDAVQEAKVEREPLRYQRINTTRTRLCRIFNSPQWNEGGRFYGGWWQSVPRRWRQHIKINGKLTCEYDFSSIHMRLLYKSIGAAMPKDIDPYSKPYGDRHRKVVKRAFNVLLNASRRPEPHTVPEFNEEELGMSWNSFLNGILRHHSVLEEYFMTGAGVYLQRVDADIAEAIMLKFVEMQQPCLPIHDSFITYKTLEDELPDIMERVAVELDAGEIPAQKAYSGSYTGPTGLVTADVGEVLAEIAEEQSEYTTKIGVC
ncbi:hypothetical protein [Ruegeria arenilitoris]|uniref:hypothetical protein n=1 Tax=Ruegeria arenilitoris TaxID=1173585 RepID=UPI00147A11D4|nr:hypothetical protein [Ruegeria arenilitoris]